MTCQTHELLPDELCAIPPIAHHHSKTVMGTDAHMCSQCHDLFGERK